MVRVLVAALLAAVVLFFWGFVWWMVLPFGSSVIQPVPLPLADQEKFVAGLETLTPASGVYFFPYAGPSASPEDQEVVQKRQREGPLVEVVYRKNGVDAMSPAYFAKGFGHMVLSALLAGTLLSLAAPALRSYPRRVAFAALLGFFGAFAFDLSSILWFNHPWQFPVMMAAFNASGWLLASLVLAAVIRPARVATTPALTGTHSGFGQHASAARQ
jgi:hypothetical protein